MKKYLVLENGMTFAGEAFGADADADILAEIVFSTAMVGYAETLTDPRYAGQAVCQTFPLIGNYGVNPADCESGTVTPAAYIVRELCDAPSNFRCEETLDEFLRKHGVPGICGIDTRLLTKTLRDNGTMNGVIENDTFAPDASASRATLITTLWRLAGEPVVNYAMNFADVPQDMWYSEAVRWAASERIVQGYDGRFNPDDPITREELAVILYRYEQKMGGGFKGMWMFPLRYSDEAEVSEWAYEAICWLTMKGIYVSLEEGVLNPAEEATRADIAAFLHRYCAYRAELAMQ